jgi:hypothetical protein
VPHSFAFFANEWVTGPSRASKLLGRTRFDLQRPLLKVHSDRTWFAIEVDSKAAPLPLVRRLYENTRFRV